MEKKQKNKRKEAVSSYKTIDGIASVSYFCGILPLFYLEYRNIVLKYKIDELSLHGDIVYMRILTEKALKDYIKEHPDAEPALQEWIKIVKNSEWTCFANIKESFNSVDNVGNQRYVFNIRGNNHRLIVIIRFTIQYVYIRFIGTHKEYDQLDSNTIRNI
jgi:mRNA interferase HigB